MRVEVWVALVQNPSTKEGATASVHATRDDVLVMLRDNYADGADVPDDELIKFVEDQGLTVTIERDLLDCPD